MMSSAAEERDADDGPEAISTHDSVGEGSCQLGYMRPLFEGR